MELFTSLSEVAANSDRLMTITIGSIALILIGAVLMAVSSDAQDKVTGVFSIFLMVMGVLGVGAAVYETEERGLGHYAAEVTEDVEGYYGIDVDEQVVENLLDDPESRSTLDFSGKVDGEVKEMGIALLSDEELVVYVKEDQDYVALSPVD